MRSPGLAPTVDFIVEMAGKFPNFGYVKEEYKPVLPRMQELAARRADGVHAVFSGMAGRGWTYEMRLGLDGTMPGAMFADIYSKLWRLHQAGERGLLRELFSKLLLMINIDQQIPGTRNWAFKRRGIFKTTVSRRGDYSFTPAQEAELEWNLQGLAPYFEVPLPG